MLELLEKQDFQENLLVEPLSHLTSGKQHRKQCKLILSDGW